MVHVAAPALAPVLSFADVTLPNGVRLHYAQQGPQSGPAIILLHGYSDSSLSFSRVMPLLPRELRVIALDLRGHGDSDRPDSGYRMQDLADDVLQVMNALTIPTAVIVGHSMGSFVAQTIADRALSRITSLVLLGSAPRASTVIAGMRDDVDALVDPIDYDFVRQFQYSTIALPVPKQFMDAAIANSRRMPARVWKQILSGMLDFRPAAQRPSLPTLVLGGGKDTVFSVAEQTQLAHQFPNARLQLFDDIGHTLHWERPESFVEALLQFTTMN